MIPILKRKGIPLAKELADRALKNLTQIQPKPVFEITQKRL